MFRIYTETSVLIKHSSKFAVHPTASIKLCHRIHTSVRTSEPLNSYAGMRRNIEVSLTMGICLLWADAN